MRSEEKISILIENLTFKKAEAEVVMAAFPDAIVKVIDDVKIRYHSILSNTACDKIDTDWSLSGQCFHVYPYKKIYFELNSLCYEVKIHTVPYAIMVMESFLHETSLCAYENELLHHNFNKDIIRLIDIEIAKAIIKYDLKIDKETLPERVKKFLILS